MKKIILTALFIILGSFILLPTTSLAEETKPCPDPNAAISDDYGLKSTADCAGIPTNNVEPTKVASAIINTVLGIVGVLAVVMIIYGGFLWLTSGGNEEKLSQAKTLLQNVVIGLFIILASYAIANFIVNSLKKATGSEIDVAEETCTKALPGARCKQITSCGSYIVGETIKEKRDSCSDNSDGQCILGKCTSTATTELDIVCCK